MLELRIQWWPSKAAGVVSICSSLLVLGAKQTVLHSRREVPVKYLVGALEATKPSK